MWIRTGNSTQSKKAAGKYVAQLILGPWEVRVDTDELQKYPTAATCHKTVASLRN
jgi:hypothetical protein